MINNFFYKIKDYIFINGKKYMLVDPGMLDIASRSQGLLNIFNCFL